MPDPDFWGLWLSVDSRHPDPPITVFQRDDPQQDGVKLLSPVSHSVSLFRRANH